MHDFISGQWVSPKVPDEMLRIVSPADVTHELAHLLVAKQQVHDAVDAAQRQAKLWRKTPPADRASMLKRYQAALQTHSDALAQAISFEIGKPLWEAKTEVAAMVTKVDVTLKEAVLHVPDFRVADLPGEVRHRPLGVVAVIGPFNFPGHLPNGQIVPALLAGNTVVFKPSEKGATTAVLMAKCFAAAGCPAGVFNVVQGAASVAETLASHEGVQAILFTGSLAVGRRIIAANAHRPGVLVALELGGKNASLVLDDADLERTVRELAFSGFATAGQRCTATSRVIVTRRIADGLCERLAQAARGIRVGHPSQADVFMGPVISASTRDGLLRAQALATAAGFASVAPGGEVEVAGYQGWYVRPAVYRAPKANSRALGYSDVELFAPDLAVYVVDSLEEAAQVANDSPFGLSAAVFTQNRSHFEWLADELDVGVLHWNRSSAGASGRLPFGGIKGSGNHRPGGLLMSNSCVYPLAVLEPPAVLPALPSWPGINFS
jgi:succinylglutamic semialdehyde dehydrogenase